MYAVTVSFTLRPGARADFLPLMTENARLSLQLSLIHISEPTRPY